MMCSQVQRKARKKAEQLFQHICCFALDRAGESRPTMSILKSHESIGQSRLSTKAIMSMFMALAFDSLRDIRL